MRKSKVTSPRSSRPPPPSRRVPKPHQATKIPLAIASSIGPRPYPSFTSSRGKLVVTHTEYIASVTGVGTFTPIQLTIQPGSFSSFPWLYPLASRYESFWFRRLAFHYAPACSASTGGQFGMVFDFDPLDPAPTDLLSALSYFDRAHGSVYGEHHLVVDLNHEDARRNRYVRMGPAPVGADLKTYDLGNLFYYCDATVNRAGLLSIEYTIEFCTPQLEPIPQFLGGTVRNSESGGATPIALLQGAQLATGFNIPATLESSGLLRFIDPWEGIINATVQAVDLKGLNKIYPSVVGGQATFIHGIEDYAEEGLQTLLSSHKVKIAKGGTLNLGLANEQVIPSTVDVDFASAPFSAIL